MFKYLNMTIDPPTVQVYLYIYIYVWYDRLQSLFQCFSPSACIIRVANSGCSNESQTATGVSENTGYLILGSLTYGSYFFTENKGYLSLGSLTSGSYFY